MTRFVTRPDMIEKYEKSRYLALEQDGLRVFINPDLRVFGDKVTVDMRRILGAPDFIVKGLHIRAFSWDTLGDGAAAAPAKASAEEPAAPAGATAVPV